MRADSLENYVRNYTKLNANYAINTGELCDFQKLDNLNKREGLGEKPTDRVNIYELRAHGEELLRSVNADEEALLRVCPLNLIRILMTSPRASNWDSLVEESVMRANSSDPVVSKSSKSPSRCDLCKISGHVQDHFRKKLSITPSVLTSNVAIPTVENTNDEFQIMGKKKKKNGKSKSTNGGQFGGQPVKQTVRCEPKTTITSTVNDNIHVSNPCFALDEESEEEVDNVYDESANLLQNIKTGRSLSTFTVAAG
nr:hypothetical protein [Tanacetum cinerariifolium]